MDLTRRGAPPLDDGSEAMFSHHSHQDACELLFVVLPCACMPHYNTGCTLNTFGFDDKGAQFVMCQEAVQHALPCICPMSLFCDKATPCNPTLPPSSCACMSTAIVFHKKDAPTTHGDTFFIVWGL